MSTFAEWMFRVATHLALADWSRAISVSIDHKNFIFIAIDHEHKERLKLKAQRAMMNK